MRLFMKSYVLPYDLPSSGTSHVPTQQHCNFTKQTQHQLAFQSQQQSAPAVVQTQQQLAPAVRPSPRSPGRPFKRWEEYMGVKDWAGLLDPLDEHLQAEILRYGSFIESTYRAFDFDPGSSSYGSSKYEKRSFFEDCGLPISGYRVTRHLRATSGIQVPRWARSGWAPIQTSWIGYVAVCNEKTMIDRLGRREVIIALRGTATCLEWLENLRATLAPVPGPTKFNNNSNVDLWYDLDNDGPPMVESGFLSLYTSGTDMWPSLQDALRMEVSRILKLYNDKPLSITITGHSLGAALATLAAYDIKTTFERAPLVTVISFGGPRVGNQSFRSLVDKQGTKILRVVNPSDLITKVPGFVTDNNEGLDNIEKSPSKRIGKKSHNNPNKINRSIRFRKFKSSTNNRLTKINSSNGNNNLGIFKRSCNQFDKVKSSCDSSRFSKIISSISKGGLKEINAWVKSFPDWIQQFRVEDNTQWWVYAEVGREFRLENKVSEPLPYYLSNMDVAKCHDLKTYLNLVEDCPLKSFVRRSLSKLCQRCSIDRKDNIGVLALLSILGVTG